MIVFGVLSGGNDLIEVVAVGSMERRAHIVLCPSSGCQALAGDITDNADLYLVASIRISLSMQLILERVTNSLTWFFDEELHMVEKARKVIYFVQRDTSEISIWWMLQRFSATKSSS